MKTAVVIPSYRTKDAVMDVISKIPKQVKTIYVIDDACPDKTGQYVKTESKDSRVKVIVNTDNQGVGGASLRGFKAAFDDGHEVAIKLDSDGQHDPNYANDIIKLFEDNTCGYVKGSRFLRRKDIDGMPRFRLFANAILSATNKFASGYYSLTDPTNGLIAIHKTAFDSLNHEKIAKRYFFESDMLFHLNLARQSVCEFPMHAKYGNETSHLKFSNEVFSFAFGNIKNFLKRIWVRHCLLNFSVAGVYLILGLMFMVFASIFGGYHWVKSIMSNIPATSGTVIIAALAVILGINFLTSFLLFDVNDEPK